MRGFPNKSNRQYDAAGWLRSAIVVLGLTLIYAAAVRADVEALYYDQDGIARAYFTGAIVQRTDPNVDFNFGNGSPAPGIGANDFSVVWSANVLAAHSEPYQFETVSDDGVRLYLDNVLIIDNFTDHGPTADQSAPINLVAGQSYAVRMEYYERGGGAVARLRWSSPSIALEAIPASSLSLPTFELLSAMQSCGSDTIVVGFSRLLEQTSAEDPLNYTLSAGATVTAATVDVSGRNVTLMVAGLDPGGHTVTVNNVMSSGGDLIAANSQATSAIPANGLNATYFDQNGIPRAYFTGATVNRIDPEVNFNWGNGSPANGIPADDFSVRWIGEVEPSESGNFRFLTRSDDGVRLFIDGDLVVNNFTDHGPTTNASGNIALTAGQRYQVIMEFYERGGGAVAELQWDGPSFAPQIIPSANLFPLCSLPPLPGPVADWGFEESPLTGTANEVRDSTGNGHHGTAVNGANTTALTPAIAGDPGTCGYSQFSQDSDQFIQVPYDIELNPDGDFTVAGWVRVTGKLSSWRSVITSRWANNPVASRRRGYNIYAGTNNRWQFWTGVGGALWDVVHGPPIQTNVWTHVAVTYESRLRTSNAHLGTKRLYVNGALAAQGANRGYSPNRVSDTFIGAGENTGGFFHFEGDIDEMHVFSGRLKDAEVRTLMAETRPCQSLVDHYQISHSGSGLTCEAEAVTITAHDNAVPTHNPVEPNTRITVSTIPPSVDILLKSGTPANFVAGVGSAEYTYAPGESAVEFWFRQTTPASVAIDVLDDNNVSEDGAEDPLLEFRDTAVRFFADGTANTIGTQIAAKSSTLAPGAQTLTLRAIETNSQTGACEARLVPSPVNVDMAFQCINPTSCAIADAVTINGTPIASNPASGVAAYLPVPLDFGANGTATLDVVYPDAGIINLHARVDLPEVPPDPAPAITLAGTSNSFVVKPAGLCVEAPNPASACPTGDANCGRFVRAGEAFDLLVKGVAWQTAGEADADFCSGNGATPNFRLSNIALEPELIAPSGGVPGSLFRATADIVSAGELSMSDQAQSEVGVFGIRATPNLAYHGETIAPSLSANIGRFYPARFGVVVPSPPTFADTCGAFSYQDQPFYFDVAPTLSLRALNADGLPTLNYAQAFFKLTTDLPRGYTDQAGQAANFLATLDPSTTDVTISGQNDFDGIATLSLDRDVDGDSFVYRRVAAENPFNADVDLNFDQGGLTDSDGVCYDPDLDSNCDDLMITSIGATELRFGRLALTSAFGSELLALAIPITAEYFENGLFRPNTADACTTLDLTSEVRLSNPDTGSGAMVDGTTAMNIGLATSSITSGNVSLSGGVSQFVFSPPGSGQVGFIDITTLLGPTQPWLRFNWSGGASFDQEPTARASFGLFPGRDEIIYIREPWD